MTSAFHQLELDKNSRYITAYITTYKVLVRFEENRLTLNLKKLKQCILLKLLLFC